ncbi:MAG: aminotransferase class V-fold PLP-dependent enzyme [Planctomycetes bacterium]|nr:aminotransferase class V-fold PLP-dependent enzyme [Planctomycetota bacterium]
MPELLTESERHALFPVTREWAYLDNARRGAISMPAAAFAMHYVEGLRDGGVTAWPEWQEVWDSGNAGFARYIGADVDEIQFLVNATESFARVTLGIDWKPGDHAVVWARDYPGLVRPVLDLKRKGVEVSLVPDRADHSRPVQDALDAITEKTRLVAASWVDFRTGWKIDAKSLAAACRERGVLSHIDAVQAVGAMSIDMHDIGCDFATFAIRKYLCGLDTLGVLYVRRESLQHLQPHTLGLFSVENPFDFEKIEQPLAAGSKRFALGTPSMVQVYSLKAALELHARFDADMVFARVNEIAGETMRLAREAGYKAFADDWDAAHYSQIVVLKREGKLADEKLQDRLQAAKVAASARQGILRIAPHWYNSRADLQRLFDVLA